MLGSVRRCGALSQHAATFLFPLPRLGTYWLPFPETVLLGYATNASGVTEGSGGTWPCGSDLGQRSHANQCLTPAPWAHWGHEVWRKLVGVFSGRQSFTSLNGGVGMGWKERKGFLFPLQGIPGR